MSMMTKQQDRTRVEAVRCGKNSIYKRNTKIVKILNFSFNAFRNCVQINKTKAESCCLSSSLDKII